MSANAKHVLGLDLGQAADYTALVSRKVHPNSYGLMTTRPSPHSFVDFVHRWPSKPPTPRSSRTLQPSSR
jgi:hypothetical protein